MSHSGTNNNRKHLRKVYFFFFLYRRSLCEKYGSTQTSLLRLEHDRILRWSISVGFNTIWIYKHRHKLTEVTVPCTIALQLFETEYPCSLSLLVRNFGFLCKTGIHISLSPTAVVLAIELWQWKLATWNSPCLVAKFKNPNLSHRKRILHAWSIKSRRLKNKLHSLLVNCEKNLINLIRPWL